MRRKKDKSNGITALYERLSRDDDNAGESNSIVHQKQMLEDYAIKHGFTIAAISGNELIIQIHRALSTTIDRFIADMRRHILRNFQTGNQLQYAHEQIVDALARRDKAQLILAINHHFNVISANMEQNL